MLRFVLDTNVVLDFYHWANVEAVPIMAEHYARYRALVSCVPEGDAPPLPRCKDCGDQKFLELATHG